MDQVSVESRRGSKQTELVTPIISRTLLYKHFFTGSEISLIIETLRMSIPSLKKKSIQKSFLLAKTVTVDCLDTLDMLHITVRLGEEVFSHDVQVVMNATQPAILG